MSKRYPTLSIDRTIPLCAGHRVKLLKINIIDNCIHSFSCHLFFNDLILIQLHFCTEKWNQIHKKVSSKEENKYDFHRSDIIYSTLLLARTIWFDMWLHWRHILGYEFDRSYVWKWMVRLPYIVSDENMCGCVGVQPIKMQYKVGSIFLSVICASIHR